MVIIDNNKLKCSWPEDVSCTAKKNPQNNEIKYNHQIVRVFIISYCFEILDVTVLEDMTKGHPSKTKQYTKHWELFIEITLALSIPNCTFVFATIQISCVATAAIAIFPS